MNFPTDREVDMRKTWLALGVGLALGLGATPALAQDFDATLARHLAAVSARHSCHQRQPT